VAATGEGVAKGRAGQRLLGGDRSVDQLGLLIYDGRVGFSLKIEAEPLSSGWQMVLRIRLSRAEANDLFLAGDTMVTWPTEGLVQGGDLGLERSGMFVSEIAALSAGLRISYAERGQAERAVDAVRTRLAGAGLGQE
jgi:hypothetical protein